MEAYTGFAQVYDMFMDNVPYEEWRDIIVTELKKAKIEDGLVLELGCGTGKMTRLLAACGYDMIGLDMSEEMLMIARASEAAPEGILYIGQDMRDFELYGTVRAVISICDSVNYILEEQQLKQVFSLVNNYLDPGGVFLFDINTKYKYEQLLADHTIVENREEGSFIWENEYDKEEEINTYDLTLFIREGGLYRKYEETHYQRMYELDTIRQLIIDAGMEYVGAYDMETGACPGESSERVYIIAREHGKQQK